MTKHAESFAELPLNARVRQANSQPVSTSGDFVLYWMIAARRTTANFALDRAVAWAAHLRLPLIVFEPLRCDYPWASDRLHRFVIDGMAANRDALADRPVLYFPYVEPTLHAGRGLLRTLAENAAVVITDEYPCFFLPAMVARAATTLAVRLESVDSNGILPLASADRAFTAAVHYRRYMQRELRGAFRLWPSAAPFADAGLPRLAELPGRVRARWSKASDSLLDGEPGALDSFPIDHDVAPVAMRGGQRQAQKAMRRFVSKRLSRYDEYHNHPDEDGTSRLSPYLHFGHLSAHEVMAAVLRAEQWSLKKLGAKATGLRDGWWGVSKGAEAFLDQLVVWRELAFNTCTKRPDDYDRYESLPGWALDTLATHADDERPYLYSRQQLERAETHDEVWNAAQRQMMREGWFHNYMRMLWGKKILEWSATPRDAIDTMIAMMNRWSLDGRDPNSYAGYFWTLGRYDRPWPERAIYGTVRSMSTDRALKKVHMARYLSTFGSDERTFGSDEGTDAD